VKHIYPGERCIEIASLAVSCAGKRLVACFSVREALAAKDRTERHRVIGAQPFGEHRRIDRLGPIRLPVPETVGHLLE